MTASRFVRIRSILASLGLCVGAACLIGGCAAPGTSVQGFDKVTLAPGVTGNCTSSPCQVLLQMPPGTGTFEVTGNEVRVGTYPAGQLVSLGSYAEDISSFYPVGDSSRAVQCIFQQLPTAASGAGGLVRPPT